MKLCFCREKYIYGLVILSWSGKMFACSNIIIVIIIIIIILF